MLIKIFKEFCMNVTRTTLRFVQLANTKLGDPVKDKEAEEERRKKEEANGELIDRTLTMGGVILDFRSSYSCPL